MQKKAVNTSDIRCFYFFPWEDFADYFACFPPILTKEQNVMMSGRESYGTGVVQAKEKGLADSSDIYSQFDFY